MASIFRLKRKVFGEYGTAALAALREGKAAGLQGKELRSWVAMNKGNTGGNMVSLTNAPNRSLTPAKNLTAQKPAQLGGNGAPKILKGADAAFGNVTKQQNNIMNAQANRAAQRAKNIANPGAAAAKAGFARGQASVGIKQGAMNTWNRMGKMGKAGTVAGLAAGTYMLGKGIFGGKKDK